MSRYPRPSWGEPGNSSANASWSSSSGPSPPTTWWPASWRPSASTNEASDPLSFSPRWVYALPGKSPDKSKPKQQNVTKFRESAAGRWLAIAALCLGLAAPCLAAAQPDEEKITVNFVNADIQSVIKTIGQHTGKNFILDP